MIPYYADDTVTLFAGDCVQVLAGLPAASADAVVTDPPYGLGFMGKAWDSFRSTVAGLVCDECGNDDAAEGYRLCTDCLDRSLRDGSMLGHQSMNWSEKATHSRGYADNDPRAFQWWCSRWAAECLRVLKPGGHLLAFGGTRTFHRLTAGIEDAGFEVRDCLSWLYGSGFPKSRNLAGEWAGWGTALKPAWEPIIVARKPLAGTVVGNVLAHGTGALNVDGCRVGTDTDRGDRYNGRAPLGGGHIAFAGDRDEVWTVKPGRWPANLILDGRAAETLDRQSGDTGGASRFFYTAKAGADERPVGEDGTRHPTVKPVDLMRWLVRLVTPPGGLVLDPFAGSGTTGEACVAEGFRCLLIEREPSYLPLIVSRLSKPIAPVLDFGAA